MTGVTTINMKVPECRNDLVIEKTQKSPSHWKRTLIVASAVFSGVLLVSVITLAAVYFGSHLTRKAYEGQVTLHTVDGATIKEDIAVRETEVEIREPGKFSVINDYNRRLSVFKFDDGTKPRCYLAHLNTSVMGTREEIERRIKDKDVFVPADTPIVEFVTSEIDVNAAATDLGDNARIMCEGIDLQWLTPLSTDSGLVIRNKRQCGEKKKDPPKTIIIVVVIVIKEKSSACN